MAVAGRCFQGAGALGPGRRRQWDSTSCVLWPGCTSSLLAPLLEGGAWGASGKPQPRPTALSRVRTVPLWGLSVVAAGGRAGSELPSGSWTGRPVLFPGSDFNTETSRPSPFICKVGSSFPSPHCSPGPWGAAGVLCAGQGASGTPRQGTCHHRDKQTLGYSQSQHHSYRGPRLQLEGLFCALVSGTSRKGEGTPPLTVCDPVTLGLAEMGGLQEVVWQCLTLSMSAGAGRSSSLRSDPSLGAGQGAARTAGLTPGRAWCV